MNEQPTAGAEISACGLYRYRLWRDWTAGRRLRFFMLNPSTAGATDDDPTIRKCIGFARRLSWGGIDVINLFALRSTDPKALPFHPNPIGPDNDAAIAESLSGAGLVICAWGNLPSKEFRPRVAAVLEKLARHSDQVLCLGRTRDGAPRHPARLAYATPLETYP